MRFTQPFELETLTESKLSKSLELQNIIPTSSELDRKTVYLYEITNLEWCDETEATIIRSGEDLFMSPLTPPELIEEINIHLEMQKL